jgi:putative ABC transport system ATP-binding protein
VVNIPDWEIPAGKMCFLSGPSGCGKSTLLEILAGIQKENAGEVRIGETLVSALGPLERDRFRADHLGYVFQSFNLIPYLNVQENVQLALEMSEVKRKKVGDSSQKISELLESLGMGELQHRPVTELSIGQQQRVALARALIGEPELILADEPTSALDYDHREKFLKLLFQEARKVKSTVLFVSHDRSLEKLFDQSIAFSELSRGRS